ERRGARPAAIQARAELGLARIARGRGDDATRGHALVGEAIAAAGALGMDALAARWRAALATGDRPPRTPGRATLVPTEQPGYWRGRSPGQGAAAAPRGGVGHLRRPPRGPPPPAPGPARPAGGGGGRAAGPGGAGSR